MSCWEFGEIGAARSITVSPRGALLFVAKLFTLLFNKWAARASDETKDSLEDNEAAVNDIDDSGEFENPVADESPRGSKQLAFNKDLVKNPAADESQESHSPSPSWCLCKPWHCVVGWPQVHVDSTACRGT